MSLGALSPRASPQSVRGVLIVEAVLSAVVIAVGLVFISRGLSSHLKALQTVEAYDTLLALARSTLLELEGQVSENPDRPPTLAKDDTFPEPHQMYQWSFVVEETDEASRRNIELTVRRTDRPSPHVQLSAMWPTDWVPEGW